MGNVHFLPSSKGVEIPEFSSQNVQSNTFSLVRGDSVPHISCTASRRPLKTNSNQSSTRTATKAAAAHSHNGVAGVHVSSEMVTSLTSFWWTNVEEGIGKDSKLEMAVLIFIHMFDSLKHDKNFKLLYQRVSIRHLAERLLHMTYWLILALNETGIDLHAELQRLGKLHRSYGIRLKYFQIYLAALHAVFEEYFPNEYTIEIKHSLDHIFTNCVQIMFGKKMGVPNQQLLRYYHLYNTRRRSSRLTLSPHAIGAVNNRTSSSFVGIAKLIDWNESRSLKRSTQWLTNLNTCLQSQIGREYFFRYLQQIYCREIVMFLGLYEQFKRSMSEKEKFMVLRKIDKWCIGSASNQEAVTFAINISYETKRNFMQHMQMLEGLWKSQCKSPRSESFSPTSQSPASATSDDDDVEIIVAMDDGTNVAIGGDAQQSAQTLSSLPATQSDTERRNAFEFKVDDAILDAMLFETKRLLLADHWQQFCQQIESMNINDLEY